MDRAEAITYTLGELASEIARRLDLAKVSQASARVSPAPDRRTLRYYTTLGLLDRPIGVWDRQARYGERHVLQALAVKALQSSGTSLAAIQVALSGLDDGALTAVAANSIGASAVRQRFWAASPSQVTTASADTRSTPSEQRSGSGSQANAPAAPAPAFRHEASADSNEVTQQTTLVLAPGVALVLQGVHHFDVDMAAELRHLASPLIAALSIEAHLPAADSSSLSPLQGDPSLAPAAKPPGALPEEQL